MGSNDKGKAVEILVGLFRRQRGEVRTVGIGDTLNDVPMLKAVDLPLLVQKPDGAWEEVDVPHLVRVQGIGPDGWTAAILDYVARL